jgi:malate dehydrogenase (oxaloacetate-decarboxylating)
MLKLFQKKLISGVERLDNPLLNKSTAFNHDERLKYALFGLLPSNIETLEEQLFRTREAFDNQASNINKHIYLRALQDRNETLFYRFLLEHMEEMLPLIYTPTVGQACQEFSRIYRKSRGIFLSYSEKEHIPGILKKLSKERDVQIIVMTDGERILGLGDQGVGGLGISIGKLSLYSLCAGIHPKHTLPIVLDVGTNNQDRLHTKDYLGWRHERITGEEYLNFVEFCIHHIKKNFPKVLLQFEDFAQHNANNLLNIYKNKLCCFNDDIQGTAAVAAATIIAAIEKIKAPIQEQKIVIFGAGSAGCGIAQMLVDVLIDKGLMPEDAYRRIYMIDKYGLIHDKMTDILDFQKPFAQSYEELSKYFPPHQNMVLEDVILQIQPNALIGVSGQPHQFTEQIIKNMCSYVKHPIIFPLSNPNERCEAEPNDILRWSEGKAIVATGSPFSNITYQGKQHPISQCNNSYIFPGMGLGVIAGKINRVSSGMFKAATLTLARLCETLQPHHHACLLPEIKHIRQISQEIAKAVILKGIEEGHCKLKKDMKTIELQIQKTMWEPHYE